MAIDPRVGFIEIVGCEDGTDDGTPVGDFVGSVLADIDTLRIRGNSMMRRLEIVACLGFEQWNGLHDIYVYLPALFFACAGAAGQ